MRTMAVAELQERAAELEQLSTMLSAAESGHGQVCVVEGPSGVGKSRLLDECAASAEALGMRTLRARCSELTRDYPFGVARNLFESIVVRADAETRATLAAGARGAGRAGSRATARPPMSSVSFMVCTG